MRSPFADGNSNRVLRSSSALEAPSDRVEVQDILSNKSDIKQPGEEAEDHGGPRKNFFV